LGILRFQGAENSKFLWKIQIFLEKIFLKKNFSKKNREDSFFAIPSISAFVM
jgi:hypothetical protein